MVRFAAQVAADPDAATTNQTEHWADLKAAYRLIDNDHVTFDAIARPHWEATKNRSSGDWLILADTTEVDFGYQRQVPGLGPIGTGSRRGFLLHSGLMVGANTEEVIGLAGARLRYRKPKPQKESRTQRLARDRETQVWSELVDQIGPPPPGARFIQVCDRGADNFEVYCRLLLNRQDWVIRVAQKHRLIFHQGEKIPLSQALDRFIVSGVYQLIYRSKEGSRTVDIEVRRGVVMVPRPQAASPWVREQGITLIGMNVIEVREVNAPPGVTPLNWVLYTSLSVSCFEDAYRTIEYYEKRPLVEEYHKALKTGCQVESRQYRTSDRLESITSLLSITAVRLLQLRAAARTAPDTPAQQVVPSHWVEVLRRLRRNRPIETARQFYRELAGLGGHLLRKCDGEPGWITIWRGFEKLHFAIRVLDDY